MRLRDLIQSGSKALMTSAHARDLLHGAVRLEDGADGWVRPWRFTAEQLRALGSCQAWHPGLFRQMARATSGICLEFDTDSSEVAIEVGLDREPSGTRAVLDDVDANLGRVEIQDGLSADVDGRHLDVRLPRGGDDYLTFLLDDPDDLPAGGALRLPGFGGSDHHVRVWLPALRGCLVRDVIGNGTRIDAAPARGSLLVLGDSIAQGFCAGDPGLGWPERLASMMGLDLVNQGIGGQVFQPGSLLGLAAAADPAQIVVELGENYRYEPCRPRLVSRDVRAYLAELARLWPGVPTWVLTPLWHDEQRYPSHEMGCLGEVPAFLAAHTAPFDEMTLIDGGKLLDHDARLMADGYEHPNAEGSRQIAERLDLVIHTRSCSQEDLRSQALEALEDAPRRAFPLAECVRRGIVDVIAARPGCVAARTRDGRQLLWASDHDLGRLAISAMLEPAPTACLEPALVRDVRDLLGLDHIEPFQLATYAGEGLLPADDGRDIRPLSAGDFLAVRAHYAHPDRVSDERLEQMLGEGCFLGGYEDEVLVGFVGERDDGAIGMLEVFEGHRKQGWGAALETALANKQIARGWRPWCAVAPKDRAAKALQRELGFELTPANEQCWLSAGAQAEG